MTDDDKAKLADAWEAGELRMTSRIELSDGWYTVCLIEAGGERPPRLTMRRDVKLDRMVLTVATL